LVLALVIIGVAIYLMTSSNSNGTAVMGQTDFVIPDTSSIGKIFIASTNGTTATLSRESEGTWMVNGKYKARPDGINTMLSTFKNIYIQRPVPKESIAQVSRTMAGGGSKVEIYDNDGDWIKTWYVGHATMDNKGTYMVLETPKYGLSTAPYIMDKKGFIGILNTRFFTNENEWRDVVILKYDELTIKDLKIDYPDTPDDSFRIEYKGGNDISLFRKGEQVPVAGFDTSLVKDYLLNFKLASFENFKTGLSEAQQDSVKMTTPYQVITVEDPSGVHTISLWPKFVADAAGDTLGGTGMKPDEERIYAASEDGELALAQRFVWEKYRAPIRAFIVED
jgi:hypothetical protein